MNFDFNILVKALVELLSALPITLSVGLLAMLIGLGFGIFIGIVRYFKLPGIDLILRGYVSFFRGTPLMIQLFLFFFGLPQLFPSLGNIGAFEASVLIMSMNSAAYIAETTRAAILSVDKLQQDAGLSVGLTLWQTMLYVQLPQALRVAIPSFGNTFIGIIQGTALTFMLGLNDLMGLGKMKAAVNYKFFEIYLAVGLIYWAITLIIGQANKYLENHYSKGRMA